MRNSIRPQVSVFIATSLDGFISRTDGRIDWLEAQNGRVPPGEDCGYGAFYSRVDVLVLGRASFEKVLSFPEWPYGPKPVVVLSSRPEQVEVPDFLRGTVSVTDESPSGLLERLSTEGFKHVYLDGGRTIQSFLSEGLVDHLTVTLIPVLLGSGRPLFGPLPQDMGLKLCSTQSYPFGFVQLSYEPEKQLKN